MTCPSLSATPTRVELTIANFRFLHDRPRLTECMAVNPVQFLLDYSTMHTWRKCFVKLFKLTRNYCHRLHVSRTKVITLVDCCVE